MNSRKMDVRLKSTAKRFPTVRGNAPTMILTSTRMKKTVLIGGITIGSRTLMGIVSGRATQTTAKTGGPVWRK